MANKALRKAHLLHVQGKVYVLHTIRGYRLFMDATAPFMDHLPDS